MTSAARWLVRWMEPLALASVLGLLWMTPPKDEEFRAPRSTLQISALVLLAGSLIAHRRTEVFRRVTTWCLLLLLAMLVVTSALSDTPGPSISRIVHRFGMYVLLALAGSVVITTAPRVQAAYVAIALSFVTWVVYCTGLYFVHEAQVAGIVDPDGRLGGVFQSSPGYSAYLVATMPIVFCGFSCCARRVVRLLIGGGLVLSVVNLWWSGTRAAFAVFIPSALVAICFGLRGWRRRAAVAAVLVGVVTAGCLIWPRNLQRIGRALPTSPRWTGWLNQRMDMWRDAWELIRERPMVGYGYDARVQTLSDAGPVAGGRWVHNNLLQLWKEGGLLSLVPYVAFVIAQMVLYVRLGLRRRHRALAVGLILSAFAVVVTGLTENTFAGAIGQTLWLETGLGVGMAYGLLDADRRAADWESPAEACRAGAVC
jgi:O-antigen ligase